MEDEKILDLYWARSEAAVAETERKYGAYCRVIATSVLGSREDAEEIADDVWLRLWNAIPPARPTHFKAYIGTTARRLSLDALDARRAQKRGGEAVTVCAELTDLGFSGSDTPDDAEAAALRDALERFLRSLPDRTRIVFLRRYWYMIPVADIAASLGTTPAAVSSLLQKTRKKLASTLKKEGFTL